MGKETKRVITVQNVNEYEKLIKTGLVIVDYNTTWCGPCKNFAPVFEEIALKYPETVFLSVDAEKIEHEDCESISSVPTFKIILNGEIRREFSGIDRDRLERYINRYQIQIHFNGKVQRSFTTEDRERINKYMDKYPNE